MPKFFSLILVLLLLLPGCLLRVRSDAPEGNVDEGGTRTTALGLFFDLTVDDALDTSKGDRSDWRYILVTEPGRIKIRVHVDHPEKLMGTWYLRDPVGRPLHIAELRPEQKDYETMEIPVEPGKYQFEFEALKGASVYTVGASFKNRWRPIKDVSVAEGSRQEISRLRKTERIMVDDQKSTVRIRRKKKVKEVIDTTPPKDVVRGTFMIANQKTPTEVEAFFDMDRDFGKMPADWKKKYQLRVVRRPSMLKGKMRISINRCQSKKCVGTITSSIPIKAKQIPAQGLVIHLELR